LKNNSVLNIYDLKAKEKLVFFVSPI